MFSTTFRKGRWVVVMLGALTAVMALSTSASAKKSLYFEQTTEAFWAVPHACADGSTVEATLLVQSTRDFESPDTEDADPTARVQYLAVCPDGTSFSWGAPPTPATIITAKDFRSVTVTGTGIARDNLGGTHQVSFDVKWTGVRPLKTTVNGPGSKRKQRKATATGHVIFDGRALVNGEDNHPTRPDPFIRIDTEKTRIPRP